MMTKKLWLIIIWLVLVVSTVVIINKSDTKSSGWYLDRIVELRQQKQNYLDEIKVIDEKILEYREIMNNKQYEGIDYLGKSTEAQQPVKSWTQAEVLEQKTIEM